MKTYLESLVAGGVDPTRLEMFSAQKERALTAASPPAQLAEALQTFLDGKDHSQKAFTALLVRVLKPALEADAKKQAIALKVRGLPSPTAVDQALAIKTALSNTSDIRQRLLAANAVTAGLSLKGFLGLDRLALTVASIRQHARDLINQKVFRKAVAATSPGTGFTGRRQWSSPSGTEGRYGELQGTIVDPGENFSIGARTVDGRELPAQDDIPFPRWDPEDTVSWSNNKDEVLYEYVDDNGDSSWV